MDNQPHIQTMGAFDPSDGFGRTFYSLMQLLEGATETPDVLPIDELFRAFEVGMDTLEVISQMTRLSMMTQLAEIVGEDKLSDLRLEAQARSELRSPEEESHYRMSLLHKLATYIPHEVDLDTPDD